MHPFFIDIITFGAAKAARTFATGLSGLGDNIDLQKLIEMALDKSHNNDEKHVFGVVSEFDAKKVKAKTKIDISGYKRVIYLYEIRHVLNRHGRGKKLKPNEIAIETSDFYLIPEIVKTNEIEYRNKDEYGNDVIRYVRLLGNIFYYVEVIAEADKEVYLKSMWKEKR